MYNFFSNCKIRGEKKISKKRRNAVKSSVLSRIDLLEEEKPMKKHFAIRPLIVAAAISATAVASLATANAATNGAIVDGITKTFSYIINGTEVECEIATISAEDGDVTELTISIPDDADIYNYTIEEGGGNLTFKDGEGNSIVFVGGDDVNVNFTTVDVPVK